VVQGDEGGKAGDSDPDERKKKEDIAFGAECLHQIIVSFVADQLNNQYLALQFGT
jgi:hypothetical protein